MSKRRNYRKKINDSDEDESENETKDVFQALEDRKELQKFRQRTKGVTPEALAAGKIIEPEKDKVKDDPFKLKSGGGLTEMTSKFGTEFSSETNQRDEDLQLLKYIEEEMKKKKGVTSQEDEEK